MFMHSGDRPNFKVLKQIRQILCYIDFKPLSFILSDGIIHSPALSYSLTPWCRVLPEQLTGLQLVKKFPAFHGTPRFITALKSVRHLSLSWASTIQSIYLHPTSWRSILILSTHLLSTNNIFPKLWSRTFVMKVNLSAILPKYHILITF